MGYVLLCCEGNVFFFFFFWYEEGLVMHDFVLNLALTVFLLLVVLLSIHGCLGMARCLLVVGMVNGLVICDFF